MRKAWKKAVSVLLTLVLIFGVLPGINVSAEDEGGQGSGNSVEITLDNGTYDDTYKNKYGTIQYSTNYKFKKGVKTVYSPTTTYTIKKLAKGKRYYVKVCPYTVYDDGTRVFGQNSYVKTVVVKKK